MNLEWSDVRYFLAVARHGRLAKAARALGVEHTTVGRRLEALERTVGAALFDRTAHGHLLTRAGSRVLERAQAMEEAARRFEAEAQASRAAVEGRVRLALIESFAVTWLAPHLPALAERHPRLELQVLTGNAQTDLSRGEAELAIRTPRPPQRELTAVRLGASDFALFATREVAARLPPRGLDRDPPAGPTSGAVPLLVYSPELTFLQSAPWFQRFLAGARVALVSNSTLTLLAAARAHAGVAVLPAFAVPTSPDLVRVARREVARHEAWLVTHPDFRRDPRVRAVATFLKTIAPDLMKRAPMA
ncbi:MAG TPA: LysR family transcriptional regulator [Polyangia bacterium]|nr:LysR family transcriptional regulator [Polyangia bacterium]